jgi:hypothetical protein
LTSGSNNRTSNASNPGASNAPTTKVRRLAVDRKPATTGETDAAAGSTPVEVIRATTDCHWSLEGDGRTTTCWQKSMHDTIASSVATEGISSVLAL